MAQKNGDFFRTARFGGFNKADVMQYIGALTQRLHGRSEAMEALSAQLRESRAAQLRWMEETRQQRRRGAAANQVQRELALFQKRLDAAQALTAEVEKENVYLRERVRQQEEAPAAVEPPGVPLEQLTFRLFMEDLEGEDNDPAEFAYLSI
jgi:exonuclease VII large subunit